MIVVVVMMVVVAMIGVAVMMVVVAMILVVVMMVLLVVFFFFIPYVYRGLVSSVITIDNKITIKNLKNVLYRMHQRRKLSYLLFAYTVSEDLIRGNEVLQCVVRPVSQMLLPHLAIWAFLVFFCDVVISNHFSSHGVFKNEILCLSDHDAP